MDVDTLYELYKSCDSQAWDKMKNIILIERMNFLKIVLHPIYDMPTISTLRNLSKLVAFTDDCDLFDEIFDHVMKKYKRVLFPGLGMSNEVEMIIEMLRMDMNIEDHSIWRYIKRIDC